MPVKIYSVTDFTYLPKSYVYTSDVYGIAFRMPVSNFIHGDGYIDIELNQLMHQMRLAIAAGKKTGIAIPFGMFCTTPFYEQYPYVSVIEKHHEGEGDPVPMKIPVFFYEAFLTKVANFIEWFSSELKKDAAVWNALEKVDITGINQKTEEFRVPDQDFQPAGDPYKNASYKWLAAGYSVVNVIDTCISFMDIFAYYFEDKIISLPIISGLAGFPCINKNGVCLPHERFDINQELIRYGKATIPSFEVKWSALYGYCNIPPDVTIFQLNQQKLGNPVISMQQDFRNALQWGADHGATAIEVFEKDVLVFNDVIKSFKN